MVRETLITPKNFIYPLFIHEEDYKQEISSMPDCFRHSLKTMMEEVGEAMQYGIGTFILFPKVPDSLKTNFAEEAYNPNGIVPRGDFYPGLQPTQSLTWTILLSLHLWRTLHKALAMIKSKYPNAIVCTDIALDPYSDQVHVFPPSSCLTSRCIHIYILVSLYGAHPSPPRSDPGLVTVTARDMTASCERPLQLRWALLSSPPSSQKKRWPQHQLH